MGYTSVAQQPATASASKPDDQITQLERDWLTADRMGDAASLRRTIAELSQAIEQEVKKCPAAERLRTHPGVGSLRALAFVLIIGEGNGFRCGKQVASYLGLVPLEESSGNRRRLGHITKQGSSMMRFLLVEAAQVTVRPSGMAQKVVYIWCCGGAGRLGERHHFHVRQESVHGVTGQGR
jgi:transposase